MLIKTNRFRLVHASTTGAVKTRRSKPACPISTCFDEVPPRRKNIVGRIFVAVMLCFTLWAFPLPNVEGKTFHNMSTVGASFTGREETVHQDQFFPVTGTLVLQHGAERTERSIRHRLSETMVLDHSPYIKVLDADAVVATHQIGGHFVEVILSGVGDMLMYSGDADALPVPPTTTFDATGQNSLSPSKANLILVRMLRVGDSFAVAGSSHAVYSEIHTHRFTGRVLLLESFVQTQRDEVSSAGSFGDGDGSWVGFEFPTPVYIEASQPTDNQIGVVRIWLGELESRHGVLSGLLMALTFETGVPILLLKETHESVIQVSKCLLGGDAGNCIKPRCFLVTFPSGELRRSIVVADPLLAFLPRVSAVPQCPIVYVAAATKDLSKLGLLGLCWGKPELISNLHASTFVYVRGFVNNKIAKRGAIPPTTKAVGFLAQSDEPIWKTIRPRRP